MYVSVCAERRKSAAVRREGGGGRRREEGVIALGPGQGGCK